VAIFSVIIPTYNRAHTIERAIESVLNQTFKDFELIVVDDGSTDKTLALLKKYDGKIKLFTQNNQGVSATRNFAVEHANGSWLAFLDSDDEWLSHKLQLQFDFIQQNNNYPLVHGEEIWIRNGTRVNPKKKHQKGGGDQFLASLKLCAISPSVAVIKKDIFLELGGFREDFPACEDYDLWLKLTSLYEVGFIDNPLVKKYGGHGDQLSQKFKAMDYWRVKSIAWVLENRNLSYEKKDHAVKVLKKKAKILLQGYQKHQNLEHYEEVLKLYNHDYYIS
jgi:glycosyltransferase involved in cell wall biosynthesis